MVGKYVGRRGGAAGAAPGVGRLDADAGSMHYIATLAISNVNLLHPELFIVALGRGFQINITVNG